MREDQKIWELAVSKGGTLRDQVKGLRCPRLIWFFKSVVKSKFHNQGYVLLKVGPKQIRAQAHNPRVIWFLIFEMWSHDFDEGVANISRSDHPSSSWLQELWGADDYSDPDEEVNGKEIV